MNILIIGLGSIGWKHVAAIRELVPNALIYALRSSKEAVIELNIQNIYSILDIDFKLDFIIISNPTVFHEDTITRCLEIGCPLFIEKPVLANLKNSDSLALEIERKNIITYVACNMRFHPSIQFLKNELLTKINKINEVNIYCGSYLPEWRPGRDFRTIYSTKKNMGGGVHLDLIHELDYCLWLFGKPEGFKNIKRSVSSLSIDSIDSAQFHLFYPFFTANISVNYYRRDAKREIEIVTDENTYFIDLITNKIIDKLSRNIIFEQEFNMKETYINQLNYFLNHISHQKQTMNDFNCGIESLKIALHGEAF